MNTELIDALNSFAPISLLLVPLVLSLALLVGFISLAVFGFSLIGAKRGKK